jgi:CheY-like chemotaxis protein
VAAAAQASSKKSVAAALAGMSLTPFTDSEDCGKGTEKSGSLAALAATRVHTQVVHPKDVRILIADDSLTNLKILARMLQGFQLTQAINGAEAVERVKELILADPPLQPFEATNTAGEMVATPPGASAANSGGGGSDDATGSVRMSPFSAGFSPIPQAAFVKQKGRQFDLIFSDVVMPVMDGQQASREIRRLERLYHLPPVPIVALTANAFLEDRNKCADAGMSMFLMKPYARSDLLSIVQLVCQQNGLTLAAATPAVATTKATGHKSHSAHNSPNLTHLMLQPATAETGMQADHFHSQSAGATPAQPHGVLATRASGTAGAASQSNSGSLLGLSRDHAAPSSAAAGTDGSTPVPSESPLHAPSGTLRLGSRIGHGANAGGGSGQGSPVARPADGHSLGGSPVPMELQPQAQPHEAPPQ